MKEQRFVLIAILVVARGLTGFGQTIAWSGAGSSSSWFDPNNWTGRQVPGSANDVLIMSGTGTEVTVTNTATVRSIQCTKALTISGGTFTVVAGSSQVQGALVITNGSNLAATGVGTTFTGSGPTSGDGANLSASGGAVLSLPGLVSYQAPSVCETVAWQADGAGSGVSLPGLTNVTGNTVCAYLTVRASNGGQVLLSNVVKDLGGSLSVQSDGSNSLVNLSWLTENAGTLNLEASGGGSVLVPKLADGNGVNFNLAPGGAISTAQLTNISGSSLSVSGGGVMSLPGVVSYQAPGVCEGVTWQASGVGSLLSLPGLTNVTGNTVCGYLIVKAQDGGQVLLDNVVTNLGGDLSVQSDGSNSLVNLSSLAGNAGTLNLEASGGGSVLVPKLADGNGVNFNLTAGGTISTAQLVNITGAGLSVSGGAVMSLPGVVTYQPPGVCEDITWQANGVGSVLSLPGLTHVTGNTVCGFLNVKALNGGQVLLSNVTGIQNGYQTFLSDGAGSVLDLSSLSGMVLVNGLGQLTAQNGGAMLLNTQAFLLANVTINIPPGNPVLPPTLIASSSLTLYGQPWNSYLVEAQNTLIPESPFTFAARVPLTNAFQAFASAPPPNTAFRITEFVADPPTLDLVFLPGSQYEVILYGAPGKTYQIQSTTNLLSAWAPTSVVTMTNSFRIFGPAPVISLDIFFRYGQF
jgi:hypothetical protein